MYMKEAYTLIRSCEKLIKNIKSQMYETEAFVIPNAHVLGLINHIQNSLFKIIYSRLVNVLIEKSYNN